MAGNKHGWKLNVRNCTQGDRREAGLARSGGTGAGVVVSMTEERGRSAAEVLTGEFANGVVYKGVPLRFELAKRTR
jgi:hypothetical protein